MGQQHSGEQGARNFSTGLYALKKEIGIEAHPRAEQLSHELASRFAKKVRRRLYGRHLTDW